MGNIRKLFLLLCLVTAGVQSSWADFVSKGTVDFQNFTFDLYEDNANTLPHIAALRAINGTEENVVLPSYVENGGKKYYVTCGACDESNNYKISNDYVKTLTFQENFDFNNYINTSSYNFTYLRCYLNCPQLTTIVFEGVVFNMDKDIIGTGAHLYCGSLTDIYFKSTPPTLENSWSNYCTAPAGNITVHVAGWTAAQCQDKHDNALVWCDFAAVVPYSETPQMVNVNASVSDGGAFQISGQLALTNGSQTFEAEKGSDFTFYAYPSSANFQVAHVYVNGTDVISQMTTVNGQLKYTITNLQDNVTISVVGESVYEEVWVSMSSGGYVRHSTSSGYQNIHNSTKVLFIKGTTKEFLVVPTDGYELDKYWKDGVDLTNVSGVLVPTGNQGKYTVTIDKGCNILFTFKAKNLITFQDDAVKQLCVDAGWDTNGDGEISKEEAAAVESLGEAFRNKTSHPVSISTFDELQYFTGLTAIDEYAFQQSGLSSVVLPAGVTSIGRSAFASCNLTRIVLPDGLTSIGQNAFDSNSSLLSIELPQSLETIGSYAFNDTGLKNIYIPAGVTSIGGRQFEHCKDLVSIVVDKNNTVYDSRNECNAIIETATNKLINGCRNTVIPNTVTAIAGSAFRTRGVPELVIPESVTSIGDYAFMWMNQRYGHSTYYLKRMELKWETPLEVDYKKFGTGASETVDFPKQCTLVVPKGKRDAYIQAGWKTTYFNEIVEAEEAETPLVVKTNNVLNPDQLEIFFVYTYKDNSSSDPESFTDKNYQFFFDNTDRERFSKVEVRVPVNKEEYRPVRVLRNGEDVSYQYATCIEESQYLYFVYYLDMQQNVNWEISYETSHRQTFVRRGGGAMTVEVEYDYPEADFERYKYPDNIGTPLYVDFPAYNADHAPSVYITVDVEDGNSLKVLRNGAPVIFTEKPGAAANGYTRYELSEYGHNGDTQAAFGFNMRDPAVWEITIETPKVGINAYTTNGITVTTKRIMPNGDIQPCGGAVGVTHQWIFKDEGVQICFFPEADDVLKSISYNWGGSIALDDERLEKQDDGSYILTLTAQDIGTEKFIDVYAVFEKAKEVDYVFVGKYQFVSAYADYNEDISYEGSVFYENDVKEYYIGKIIENGSCIGHQMGVEFKLKNASDTFKAYRNGVEVQIQKGNNDVCTFVSEDDSMHEAAQWVIIADDGSGSFDLNHDGKVDIADVTKLVNKVLKRE